MKIVIINGNTKKEGFTAGCLSIVEEHLKQKGAEVHYIRLADAHIEYCTGCFSCLKTGSCVIDDDVAGIVELMREADGFVIGSPVRNGLTTACYKCFLERITYILGFALDLENKHTLAICSVGYGDGKTVNKKYLGLQTIFRTRLSDYLFFKVGMPSKKKPEDVRDSLVTAADRLLHNIEIGAKRSLYNRFCAAIDNFVCRKLMFNKSPEDYKFIMECWRKKGYIR